MKEYLDLAQKILDEGEIRQDRTGTGTISLFGEQYKINLSKGFPLLTTKKMFTKAIIHEIIWFISGDTNIKYLVDNEVRIWNEWPYVAYKKSNDYNNETIEEFIEKIKINEKFANKWGDLGPVYGRQWRNFNGIDQLLNLINDIKTKPYSRRLIISAWNPAEIKKMLLPPCHAFMQFYVSTDRKLSCKLYQRSADLFLGVPFNIASYSLLTHLIAHVCNLKVGYFIHTFGDVHIYKDHIDLIKQQLKNKPYPLPELIINKKIKNIVDFKYEDIKIINYQSHKRISGKVSI